MEMGLLDDGVEGKKRPWNQVRLSLSLFSRSELGLWRKKIARPWSFCRLAVVMLATVLLLMLGFGFRFLM